MKTLYIFKYTMSGKTFLILLIVFERSFFLFQVLKKINENNYLVSIITGAEFDDETDIKQYLEKLQKNRDFKLLEKIPFQKKKSAIMLLRPSKYIVSRNINISTSPKLPVGFLVFNCRLSSSVEPTEDTSIETKKQDRMSLFSKIKSVLKLR